MTPSLHIPNLALRVSDLARSLRFYVDRLGFVIATQTAAAADLATTSGGPPILTLREAPAAQPLSPQAAGLFHAALLFSDRAALGAWLRHAAQREIEFDGFSDHGVSEALYFSDPDGNGLEFYADRRRELWPRRNGDIEMVTQPLDVRSLAAAASTETAPPLQHATWGHIHLRVRDLEASERFYRETLGLHVTQRSYPGARFLAADDYHHHLGLNVWGQPVQPEPPDMLGLASVTVALRDATAPRDLVDPDGIRFRIEALSG